MVTARSTGLFFTLSLALALAFGACGGESDDGANLDDDGDGFTPAEGDCDDDNARTYPEAPEPCDGVDQNCDGVIDDGFDSDADDYTTCEGDCRDNDPDSFPGAREVIDGIDNDCDRLVDNHSPSFDDDGDGYSDDQGDCNDDPDNDGDLVGPGAIEVAETGEGEPENIDNDCDGEVDEAIEPCPTATDPAASTSFALALDVCHEVVSSSWDDTLDIDARSRRTAATFGNTYVPGVGPTFAILGTGQTIDRSAAGWNDPEFGGLSFANNLPHPDPAEPVSCTDSFGDPITIEDPPDVNDYSELSLVLQVPTNAKSFSFAFNFMSAEFPEFVCTTLDDTFIAYLESEAFTGNVSFDDNGNRVSINIGFFDVCAPSLAPGCGGEAELIGTGFEVLSDEFTDGGGTGWLTTTAPVVPGEKITLTFMIWDEGDRIYDSTVLLDDFRWGLEPVDGPETVERALPADVRLSRGPAAPGAH